MANYCLSAEIVSPRDGAPLRNWRVAKRGSRVERLDLPAAGLHFRGE